ncbi:mitochondrial carrier [Sarocladium strictum]
MTQPQTAGGAKSAQHFVSGLGSGVASAVLLQPLDLLKTRVQQSKHSSLSTTLKELRSSPHFLRSLWRGTVPSGLRTGFGSALYFTSLNALRQNVRKSAYYRQRTQQQAGSSDLPSLSKTANLLSGAAARTFAGFVLMPLTVIKVRFESSLYSYPSLAAAAKDIVRYDGFRGLFSGFGATAIRDAPYAGTYVLLYELLKTEIGSVVTARPSDNSLPAKMGASLAGTVNFSSAILAGAACSALSNPFDAVKTRIQLQPQKYMNTWHAARKMVVEDGMRSLWDGLALRISRKALSSALAWTVYEDLIRRMSQAPRHM